MEVMVGGTMWRWWWEVPCGGDDGRYPVEVVMYKGLNTSMTLSNTLHCHPTGEREGWGGSRGAYLSRPKLSSL